MAKNNILYRNIKPQNVLLIKEQRLLAKLCDFGIVKRPLLNDEFYTAPEVLSSGSYSSLADIWSIGVLLYFIINRRPPLKSVGKKIKGNYLIKEDVSSSYLCAWHTKVYNDERSER